MVFLGRIKFSSIISDGVLEDWLPKLNPGNILYRYTCTIRYISIIANLIDLAQSWYLIMIRKTFRLPIISTDLKLCMCKLAADERIHLNRIGRSSQTSNLPQTSEYNWLSEVATFVVYNSGSLGGGCIPYFCSGWLVHLDGAGQTSYWLCG